MDRACALPGSLIISHMETPSLSKVTRWTTSNPKCSYSRTFSSVSVSQVDGQPLPVTAVDQSPQQGPSQSVALVRGPHPEKQQIEHQASQQ